MVVVGFGGSTVEGSRFRPADAGPWLTRVSEKLSSQVIHLYILEHFFDKGNGFARNWKTEKFVGGCCIGTRFRQRKHRIISSI